MTTWIIEPRDPLIFRDGRPFGPTPGARARTLDFPFPSTTTGGVRTQAGMDDDGVFDTSKAEAVRAISVRGPLLVQLAREGYAIERWLVPAPGDALLLEPEEGTGKGSAILKRLRPLRLPEGARINPNREQQGEEALCPVGLDSHDPHKPAKNAPRYWYWDEFAQWLLNPPDEREIVPETLGHNGPQRELRVHVRMDSDQHKGQDGALFDTSGLEFTHSGHEQTVRLGHAERLALAVIVDEQNDAGLQLRPGLACLGSERRIVNWRSSNQTFPACPKEVTKAIVGKKACHLFLLTPACFAHGYRPAWLLEPHHGVKPELKAIVVQRPQVVSGWDMEHGKPRPTRRLAPAGTVLFLKLDGNDEDIRHWINSIWLQCVSDDVRDQRDGFGLAVVGSWSGESAALQEE
jgi:CRISPR-associated protein Cmr3